MFVKNTSKKIIGFGQTSVLPGQEIEIADSFKGNPVVAAYEALGFIQICKEQPAKKQEAPAEEKKGKKSKTADVNASVEDAKIE